MEKYKISMIKREVSPNRKEWLTERLQANQCEVCGFSLEELGLDKHKCYLAGNYCSTECYDTLFDHCNVCGKLNMTVVTNERDGKGKICDKCYMKREGLSVITIVGRF
jgi:hypothetical protein